MKKDFATHLIYMIVFFILVSLYKDWLRIEFLPFWFGGILGTILPYLDHIVYVYWVRPDDITSQQVSGLFSERKFFQAIDMLVKTRGEKKDLIFHTAYFQLIFLVFSVFIITSTGSVLGIGLVLAFMLHLLVDQVSDLMEVNNLTNWFAKFPVILDSKQQKYFVLANGILILILGFFF